MLTEARNEFKAVYLSIKYAVQREMLNKFTFLSNVILMILNNASFILQWVILFSIRDNIGGYDMRKVLILWAIAALTYGISRFFFISAFDISDSINKGKLDNYILMPKNVLLSLITSNIEVSGLGDMIYGIGLIAILDITKMPIFIITSTFGALIITAIAIIYGSLAFFFGRAEIIADTANNIMTNFSTYPEGIFKAGIKLMFYTIIPLGLSTYVPVNLICEFNLGLFITLILGTIFFISLAFIIFYKGLKRYSSTNLMNART